MLSLSRDLLGKNIGSYHLSKLIGMGGTGAVFLGRDNNGHEMAVKILIPPMLISEESLKEFHKRFQREAEILSQLNHPYILPVRDFGTDESSGFPYMVMPYKSGGTLVEQIQAGPLPFDRVMKYVWQLAQALTYAHKQNIIHRDIKPANVLLDEKGDAYLADFSIAKLFNLSTTTLTSANQMLGTPAYMAPEQVSNKAISPATDVYGLGVLTYQLLTGCLPFDVSTLLALLQRIMQEKPPPPHGIRTDLPAEVSDVLFKSLAKDPEARFESAEAFADALEESMHDVLTTSAIMRAAQNSWLTLDDEPAQLSPLPASRSDHPLLLSLVDDEKGPIVAPDGDDNHANGSGESGQPGTSVVVGTVATAAGDEIKAEPNNDPTLVAYYPNLLLEDEHKSSAPADNNTTCSENEPASTSSTDEDATCVEGEPLSPSVQNPVPAQKNKKALVIVDRNASTQKEASRKLSSYRIVPLASSPVQEEDHTTVPLTKDDSSTEQEQAEEQKKPTPAALPGETTPMPTEQQKSVTEDEEPLVTVLPLQPPFDIALSSGELAAAMSTAPQLLAKSVVNQPTSRHATIVKPSSRVQLSLTKPWPRWQIIVVSILTLLLVSEGTFSLYASGHGLFVHQTPVMTPLPLPPAKSAVIGITPDIQKIQKTFTIAAVTGLPDVKQHQVLARWISNATAPLQRTVNATGKVATPAATASGTLLFTNSSFTAPVTVPAGTMLTGQGKGANLQVILDETVNIPPAPVNYVNPKQRPMQRVRAHYITGGAAGNIGTQKFSIASPACIPASPVCYSAFNDAPFIGGTDAQNYTFVQQGDIDGASKALQTQAPNPQAFLQGQLSASEQWITMPACKSQTTANHNANDKVANVTVAITFTCFGEAYDQKGALESAKQELAEQAAKDPGDDYTLNGNINATLQSAQVADANGTVNVTIQTKGMWVFQLNDTKKQDLAKTLVGKKKLAAQHMLNNLKGVKNVTIDLQDGDENTFPADPQQIKINTQPVS